MIWVRKRARSAMKRTVRVDFCALIIIRPKIVSNKLNRVRSGAFWKCLADVRPGPSWTDYD
jgi:hypothetical protein